jgi:hypothetical protein
LAGLLGQGSFAPTLNAVGAVVFQMEHVWIYLQPPVLALLARTMQEFFVIQIHVGRLVDVVFRVEVVTSCLIVAAPYSADVGKTVELVQMTRP